MQWSAGDYQNYMIKTLPAYTNRFAEKSVEISRLFLFHAP
jgi:hypothetical protein